MRIYVFFTLSHLEALVGNVIQVFRSEEVNRSLVRSCIETTFSSVLFNDVYPVTLESTDRRSGKEVTTVLLGVDVKKREVVRYFGVRLEVG